MGYQKMIMALQRGKNNFTDETFQEQLSKMFKKYENTKSTSFKETDYYGALTRYMQSNNDSVKLAALQDISSRLTEINFILLKMYVSRDAQGYLTMVENPIVPFLR